jgi:SAM-dependent methyltransferase
MSMCSRLLDQCGLCGGQNLETVLDLGSSPPTCAMVSERESAELHHPLTLIVCKDCTLVQLSVVVEPDQVFPPDYPYSSGHSRALHDNFEQLAARARGWAVQGTVVDIGANDGTLLSKFHGWRTVGVEPTRQAERIAGPAYQDFFTEALAERIVREHGQASVVTACNVLAHVDDLDDVMRGIRRLLAPDGVLIAENHDLASVVDGAQWDTVYHEHLRFFSPESFHLLLSQYGLAARMWEAIPTHGGSFRALAGNAAYADDHVKPPARDYDFGTLQEVAVLARAEIRDATVGGVPGIGATARATTIINYCGLDVADVPYVCEVTGSDKIGRLIPGTGIPVVDEARLFDEQPPAAILFSWHLADRIVPALRERGYHGEIIVPLPTPAVA